MTQYYCENRVHTFSGLWFFYFPVAEQFIVGILGYIETVPRTRHLLIARLYGAMFMDFFSPEQPNT